MRDDGTGWYFHSQGLIETLRAHNCRMLVLVNPHNPTGRVFSRAELGGLAHVAEQLDLTVFADEIHADLSYSSHVHVSFASLDETVARRTITATSATKALTAGQRHRPTFGTPQAPRANAIMERWVGSLRRELLDRVLIVIARHLRRALAEYETHFVRHEAPLDRVEVKGLCQWAVAAAR